MRADGATRDTGHRAAGVRGRQRAAAAPPPPRRRTTTAAPTTAAATATTAAAATTTAAAGATTTAAARGGAQGGVIPAAGSGKYGVGPEQRHVHGPGGFNIDPSKCPSDWNTNQGITDTEIDLFASLPEVGPARRLRLLADGMKAYFDYVNANGGIDGRKIVLDVKDDGYQPDSDQDERRRGAGGRQVRRVHHHARHAEQPRHVGRRSTASACRSC